MSLYQKGLLSDHLQALKIFQKLLMQIMVLLVMLLNTRKAEEAHQTLIGEKDLKLHNKTVKTGTRVKVMVAHMIIIVAHMIIMVAHKIIMVAHMIMLAHKIITDTPRLIIGTKIPKIVIPTVITMSLVAVIIEIHQNRSLKIRMLMFEPFIIVQWIKTALAIGMEKVRVPAETVTGPEVKGYVL